MAKGDYRLEVVPEGETKPALTITLARAGEVLEAIPALLEANPNCYRIHVYLGQARLFSVDCTGSNVVDAD
jgi:hypothetical protein